MSTFVDPGPDADFVNLQNIAYMEGALGGDLVIYNDRSATSSGQSFTSVVKLIQPDGTSEALSLNLLAPIADGNGAYDFSWSNSADTLALLDFNNRNVHIFSVVPEPTSALMMLVAGLGLVARRVRRD